jgi:predicted ATPase/DNA-binding SARP family transcriptional activator
MSGGVSRVELRLLGPLELVGPAGPVALGGPKEQGVLAVLALSANEAVSEGALIDAVWGDEPPPSATKVLQNNVLRLRKTLAAAAVDPGVALAIEKRPGGYALVIRRDAVDVFVVDGLAAAARAALDRRNPAKASALLAEALADWRGPALIGLELLPFASGATARLTEQRLMLEELRADAELALGHHAELIPELQTLTAAEPLRERFWAQLMIALHRSGRQAEALRAFQDLRRVLDEELGLAPSAALVDLEREIATDSPALASQGELPSGFVTFVITDVEGSTRLFQSLGDRYVELLAGYHELVRDAFAEQGGIIVKSEGDGVLAAFADARDALVATGAVQLRLHEGATGVAPLLKVRIGVQSGDATPRDRDYVALAVHHASRICQAASGGQTLVGGAAARAAASFLAPPLSLVDLGVHALRDFGGDEHLYQLDHAELPSAFPPLRTVASTPHNLPRLRTSFVGRTEEMAEIATLLDRSGVVTLVGPGGVGKTRLAIEVGFVALAAFPHGVWLVDLVDVTEPDAVPEVLAGVLGVGDEPGKTTLESVCSALRGRHALLILDNCEHLIDAAADVAERVAIACPRVAVLSTSRESLRIDGEVPWRLTPLSAPDPDVPVRLRDAVRHDAVALLVDRAAAAAGGTAFADSDAQALATIAWRLDGIPLALELVAARIGDLGPNEVAEQLDQAMPLLTSGRRTAAPRHRTMEAAIEWGHALLSEDEQALLRHLAAFAGGFTREAAVLVCGDGLADVGGLLDELIHRSLVVIDEREGVVRNRLLETVREFALRRLEDSGEAEATRRYHLAWITGVAQREDDRLEGADEAAALANVDAEIDNAREALRWSAVSDGDALGGLALATRLGRYWSVRGRYAEGASALTGALAAAGDADAPARAEGLLAMGRLLSSVETERPVPAFEEALAIFRQLGDERGVFRSLRALCNIVCRSGDIVAYDAAAREAFDVAERLGDLQLRAEALGHMATLHEMIGKFDECRRYLDEELALRERVDDQRERAWTLGKLALLALRFGEWADARAKFADMLATCRALGYRGGEAWARCGLAQVAFESGDLVGAELHFAPAVEIHRELAIPIDAGWSFCGLARVRAANGDTIAARRLLTELLVQHTGPTDGYGWVWHHTAEVNMVDRRWAEAVVLFAAAGKVADGGYVDVLPDRDQAELDSALAECRRQLGDDAFERSWERGRSLSRPEVNAIALMPVG